MNLLKEYIRLIIKEEITEDIDMSRLSPPMVGVYAFAQAINKLIYEGEALPGASPIDIIDARRGLGGRGGGRGENWAPMTTPTEQKKGMSFQYSGNSFKLYLDPTIPTPVMSAGDESHDLMHAFTGYIAKAFGRRRESVLKSKKYDITPSRFNKIVIDKKMRDKVNNAFKQEFGFLLPNEVFEKPFELRDDREFRYWFLDQFENKMGDIRIADKEKIANQIYFSIMPSDKFAPGHIARRYWARRPENNQEPNFKDAYTYGYRPLGFDTSQEPEIAYKQSSEDEEELGNKMSDFLADYVTKGKKIPNIKIIVEKIMEGYSRSVGITNIPLDQFKHRFDTPEVESSLTRLFEIYNNLVQRYMVAARNAQPRGEREPYGKQRKQVGPGELAAARERYNK